MANDIDALIVGGRHRSGLELSWTFFLAIPR